MLPFSRIFRVLRPQWPDAEVFYVDSGVPDSPNITMTATTHEGEQTVMICREEYRRVADAIKEGG